MLYANTKAEAPARVDPGQGSGQEVRNVPPSHQRARTPRRRKAALLLVQPKDERLVGRKNRPSKRKRMRRTRRDRIMRTERCAQCRRKLTAGFVRARATGLLLCIPCAARR